MAIETKFNIAAEDVIALSSRGNEPKWFVNLRLDALAKVSSLELPKPDKTKITNWDFESFDRSGLCVEAANKIVATKSEHSMFVQRDNTVVKISLNEEATSKGVVVKSFVEALDMFGEIIKCTFMQYEAIKTESHKLSAIHTALINGGVFVYVPKNVVLESPLEVFFELNSAKANQVNHVLLIAEENSQVTFVENYIATINGTKIVNHISEVYVGKNANVTYSVIEQLPECATSYINRSAYVDRDGRMNWAYGVMNDGNTVSENLTLLSGNGSSADVKTVVVGSGLQKQNFTTKITHRGQNTEANILKHAVVKDEAVNIFNGIGFIEKGASKSNAQQSSRVLMLSEKARGDANPILLIDEDDVMAGHATSVGKVDTEQLYYLMSRGISRENAEKILIHAFLAPVVREMSSEEIKNRLVEAIERKLMK